ncbi:MAG: tetratricopeptide repeat protein [Cyanobacteria bacterium P01_A01_bin.40]
MSYLLIITYIEDYNNLLTLQSDKFSAYKLRGDAYHNLQNHEQAIQDWSQALAINPNDAELLTHRGISYLKTQQLAKGIEDLRQVTQLCPHHPEAYQIYLYLGSACVASDRPEEAINYLDKVIEIDPNISVAYNTRCGAYMVMGNLEKAIAELDRVIELEPQSVASYCNRGHLYAQL